MTLHERFDLLLGAVTTVFAIIIGWKQLQINQRLKILQDYVAVTILPNGPSAEGVWSLQIRNAGKVNLRLKQIQYGDRVYNYDRPRLLSFGVDTDYFLPIPSEFLLSAPDQDIEVRMYLLTEPEEIKYLATGAIRIRKISTPVVEQERSPSGQGQTVTRVTGQQIIINQVTAWSYTTKRFNWTV